MARRNPSALGVVLLVFMTDFAKVALSTGRVQASPKPESWNIGPLPRVAVILGMIMVSPSSRELAVVVSYAFAFSLLVNDVINRMLIARTRSSR
jgi:H+-transporting ATPase